MRELSEAAQKVCAPLFVEIKAPPAHHESGGCISGKWGVYYSRLSSDLSGLYDLCSPAGGLLIPDSRNFSLAYCKAILYRKAHKV